MSGARCPPPGAPRCRPSPRVQQGLVWVLSLRPGRDRAWSSAHLGDCRSQSWGQVKCIPQTLETKSSAFLFHFYLYINMCHRPDICHCFTHSLLWLLCFTHTDLFFLLRLKAAPPDPSPCYPQRRGTPGGSTVPGPAPGAVPCGALQCPAVPRGATGPGAWPPSFPRGAQPAPPLLPSGLPGKPSVQSGNTS